MLQREVVDRIMAAPGNSDRGYLTVLVDAFMVVEKLFDVPPTAFRPSPKVWSSVVRLRPRIQPEISRGNEEKFFRLVSAAFRQKRKTLMNNLKASASELGLDDPAALLAKAGIDGKRRAESLTLTEWALLADALS
jgi:16S rRNA (adenine1518-N6/adenine1519-N6)-dimethyltransferase